MGILNKIFGDENKKFVDKLLPLVEKINGFEERLKSSSVENLRLMTEELKNRLKKGETLDDILPEAFALTRESARRTLSQRHFDSQLLGGIVLHQGKIAEMKTGEGKTLSATLPVFLNALEGKGVHVVTVNDYLAKRDAVWMGQIYNLLGLSVGCIVHEEAYLYDPNFINPEELTQAANGERDSERDSMGGFKVVMSYLRPCARKDAYAAEITYGTNNEFGFDYLKDNMAQSLSQEAQRGFNYAIVDEVDSILIDEARTPLILSAPDMESSKWYLEFARIIPRLDSKTDYIIDEKDKAVTLTEEGINKIEKIMGVGNIYESKGIKYLHHLEQALRAEAIFKKDRDYVVREGEVIIVDEFTGRLMPGRRWSGGLHQAVEAKEGVMVKPESMTLASVTFQNYFRLYKKLAGMTGTAMTSAEEFDKVYKLEVVAIPTNLPMVRKDLPDKIYKSTKGKFEALVREIKEKNKTGQPVLVGTVSIEKNEFLGKLLDIEGVPHQILNAKNHEKEGEIIAQAGKFGAVTVATNMAGRGVDIILGGNPPNKEEARKVKELGGLHVIGTERHEARRIDNQLRGRSGRQGDPGSSQFFISLEDDLMRIFGGDRIKSLMERLHLPEDQPIEARIISGTIESAQSKIEGLNFDARKHVWEYDDVLNKHRGVIYKKRREFLEMAETSGLKPRVLEIIQKYGFKEEDYENKEREIGSDNMRKVEKIVCLRTLDMYWMEHLEEMDRLRDSVRLRAYGQQDPLVEYKNEAHKAFQMLLNMIEEAIANGVMKVTVSKEGSQPKAPENIQQRVLENRKEPGQLVSAKKAQVGRNDACPCGAKHPDGRPVKYKHCHGKNA